MPIRIEQLFGDGAPAIDQQQQPLTPNAIIKAMEGLWKVARIPDALMLPTRTSSESFFIGLTRLMKFDNPNLDCYINTPLGRIDIFVNVSVPAGEAWLVNTREGKPVVEAKLINIGSENRTL